MTDNSNEIEAKLEPDVHTQEESRNTPKNDTEKEDSPGFGSSHFGSGVPADVVIVRYGELALKSSGSQELV